VGGGVVGKKKESKDGLKVPERGLSEVEKIAVRTPRQSIAADGRKRGLI